MGHVYTEITLKNPRRSDLAGISARVLVMGDEVLLGAVPMEDMDLVVSPARNSVIINPDFPNFPHALVK